jgi:dipeptidyl aminopeptidase/acylaminoacyl peptidase
MIKTRRQKILLAILCFSFSYALAQKKLIDTNIYGKWPKLELNSGTKITNDGKFMTYVIEDREGNSMRVVRSVRPGWQIQWRGKQTECEVSNDGQHYIFMRGDSLGIGELGGYKVSYIPSIIGFSVLRNSASDDWVAYRFKAQPRNLILLNLQNRREYTIVEIQSYWQSQNGNDLIFQITDAQGKRRVQLFSFEKPTPKTIWSGKLVGDPLWSANDTSFLFSGIAEGDSATRLYYYQKENNAITMLVDKTYLGFESNYDILRIDAVSIDGRYLFCAMREKPKALDPIKKARVAVDVYSYKDAKLQPEQLRNSKQLSVYRLVYNIAKKQTVWMESKGTRIWAYGGQINANSKNILVDKQDDNGEGAGLDEWNWNPHAKHSIELLSLKDGKSYPLSPNLKHLNVPVSLCQFTPTGKYVLWYDPVRKNYFSYDTVTGLTHNLTWRIATNWTSYDLNGYNDEPADQFRPVGIAGFLFDDRSVLLYDHHDVYQIDLSGQKKPLCLSNYEGKRRNFRFRLAMYDGSSSGHNIVREKNNEPILANAFNLKSKEDGFYLMRIGVEKSPAYLVMQPYLLDGLAEYEVELHTPVKARDVNVFIVQRQSAAEAPNLFSTTDFKSFFRITELAPQKAFRWLNSELITWRTFNGTISQGILYKPENFDPKKKYPLIFYYYEKYSNSLHRFLRPDADGAMIDIPTLVGKDYLVFVPDIHYPLNTGQGYGCYNSVVSAAKYLSRKPWVDVKHMGINGHSRGGFESDYLITHTNIFAAAISGSGYCDAINLYAAKVEGVRSGGQYQYEVGHQRIGATLWQNQKLYLENSPILRADKVTTPVLMMNNKLDDNIPFTQGVEFFSSLRRLGKKAWMLQYDGQNHVISDRAAALDFSIRMQQFFDYYLKGASPPLWMIRGIPAKLKGIDDGLALDTSGQVP